MRFNVDGRGFGNQLRAAIDTRELSGAVVKELRLGAVRIQGDVVRSIQNSPPTGKTYRRGNVLHTASSPGNAPRTDTGRLVQSARVEPTQGGADVVIASNHAVHLEYGTRNMAPRPHLEPAAERNADELAEAVARAMGRAWED
jgi:hypothetical protein